MTSQNELTPQLKEWTGEFGERYLERNNYAEWKIEQVRTAFGRMLKNARVDSVLEVGCNIGLNMIALNQLYPDVELHAVEPFKKAYDTIRARNVVKPENLHNCSAFELPLADKSVDLAFTSGVLIHIAPGDLGRATDEIFRVSRRYVLCAEYFSHTPEEVVYHNQNALLWKRDFGGFYLDRYPSLKCVDYGFLWMRELSHYDDLTWWLMEKS